VLTEFATRREVALSQLKTELETRMVSLRNSLSLQQINAPPLVPGPAESSLVHALRLLYMLCELRACTRGFQI
jgi:hypothetical protein